MSTFAPVREAYRLATEERFWAKVEKLQECWFWMGAVTAGPRGGYGKFRVGQRTIGAHRFAYELLVGQIAEGLQLDHLCRNRRCVNPEHLEVVTNLENQLRGDTIIAANVAKTHCPAGHVYDEANTRTSRGWRQCRTCLRNQTRAYRARARA